MLFRWIRTLSVVAFAAYLSGCAMGMSPVTGFLYSDVSGPVAVSPETTKPTKVGKSTAKSILGLIAMGDASIESAMRKGGITKIHHVDFKTTGFFFYRETEIVVYGN